MALVELMEQGHLKHVISQNVDGLHRKSGIPKKNITEVHGNTNLEICKKCGKDYMRDFRVRNAQKVHNHETGRTCDNAACGGFLMDTIINFGENLRAVDLNTGFAQGAKADLMLVLGSSCRVTPAADMIGETLDNGGKCVIVNLQKTPYTPQALHIYAQIDTVMEMLMKKLNMVIPPFQLNRYANFNIQKSGTGKETLRLNGMDLMGGPYNIFKSTNVLGSGKSFANLTED